MIEKGEIVEGLLRVARGLLVASAKVERTKPGSKYKFKVTHPSGHITYVNEKPKTTKGTNTGAAKAHKELLGDVAEKTKGKFDRLSPNVQKKVKKGISDFSKKVGKLFKEAGKAEEEGGTWNNAKLDSITDKIDNEVSALNKFFRDNKVPMTKNI